MSNDSKKLLTLGNVEAIKDYIDVSSNNIKYYVDEEFKNVVNTRIQEATTAVNNSFIAKTTEITNKITLLEQTTGNKNEINELKLQLDAVKADNNAMNTALDALSAELEARLNSVSGSIMSAGQINELVNTALINSVNISSDAVEAPTVYTQNLVALIGKFGQIKATNIVGSEISGKTVKSTSGSWELNNNGAGKLANGNITWNESGNVTFGPNVKLNWSNIEGSEDATDGVEAAMNAATAAAEAAAIAQATANTATALANEAKNSIPSEARITEITRNSITTENITGTTLSGKTIKSTDDKWELNSTGAGKLANGNITWTDDGVVTFSDNVELKWGNITGAPTIPEGGVTETQVNDLIATEIDKYEIKVEQLTGKTITGATVKSSDDKWELNSTGAGYLGNFDGVKAIEWNTDGVKIQGEKVEISGDVKINGQAILDGVKSDESIQTQFAELTAEKISADSIIGNEIVGKTVKSTINETTGKPSWELSNDGSASFCNDAIKFNNTSASIHIDSTAREGYVNISDTNGIKIRCHAMSGNPYCDEDDAAHNDNFCDKHNAWGIDIGGGCNGYAAYIGTANYTTCPMAYQTGVFVNARPYDKVIDFHGAGCIGNMRKFTVNLSTLLALADAYTSNMAGHATYKYDNNILYNEVYGSTYLSDRKAAGDDTALKQFYTDRYDNILKAPVGYNSPGPVYDIAHSSVIYNIAKSICFDNYNNSYISELTTINLTTSDLLGVNNIICDTDNNINIYFDKEPSPGEEINIIKCTGKTINIYIPAQGSCACDDKLSPNISNIGKDYAYKYKLKKTSDYKYITTTETKSGIGFGIDTWFKYTCSAIKTNLIFAGNIVNETGTWYIA